MWRHQLEARIHEIIGRVTAAKPIEDDRVELKRTWIETTKAARRLAAHANGARGESILWVVGADEKSTTVPGAEVKELANWWPGVQSNFDLVHPELLQHLVVPIDTGVAIVAMLFDTRQAPYVVKNPTFGSAPESVEWELPWRDGTRTRTARRSELLRILSPLQLLPDVELMEAFLGAREWYRRDETGDRYMVVFWDLSAAAYFAPRDDRNVVLPFHRANAHVSFVGSGLELSFDGVKIGPQMRHNRTFSFTPLGSQPPDEPKPVASQWELRSPSRLLVTGTVEANGGESRALGLASTAQLRVRLGVVGSERDIDLSWSLVPIIDADDQRKRYIRTWESE